MEAKLKQLFDYQRFCRSKRLNDVLAGVESRYSNELTDDDLFLVNAAGNLDVMNPRGRQSGVSEYDDEQQ